MKVVSSRMKDAVNKAIKGAGFNNLIPITSMIGIKLEGGKLRLFTTDMTNTLCIIIDKVSGVDMDITVDADKFGKLIAKTTSEDIELIVIDDVLSVKANGTYKIPLISDEEGLVTFPALSETKGKTTNVKLTSIMQAYNINKSALAKTLENPALTGYYCGDMVISTDANVITFNDFKMFEQDEPLLISPQLMQLLTLNKQEDIKLIADKTLLTFIADDMVVQGAVMEGIEDFPADDVKAYLDEAFTSSCKVPKDLLLATLDRLALFIEPYDKNGAYFTFGRKGINIHSKKDASTEIINYVESKNFEPFMCCVDIPMLKEQLQANPDDTVKICYGNENALKIESGKVTQVIALLEDEDLDNMTE
ncbi:MAG: hypothetical protein ACLR1A_09355 [Eubacterium ventriosum]|jgi:hypothetical protein